MYSFVFGFFCSTLQESLMLLPVIVVCLFSLLYIIPLYKHTTIYCSVFGGYLYFFPLSLCLSFLVGGGGDFFVFCFFFFLAITNNTATSILLMYRCIIFLFNIFIYFLIKKTFYLFIGHIMWLVGSQFSNKRLNLGHGSENPES